MEENKDNNIRDMFTAYQFNPENEDVQAYFEKENIWSILNIQRYEPSHSAFLKWFFSQRLEHYPQIRDFLFLLISKAEKGILNDQWNKTVDMNSFVDAIITGSYYINSVSVESEYVVKRMSKIRSVDRIDIFMRCFITLYDKKGNEQEKNIEIIIENKVDSKEGKEKKNKISNPTNEEIEYSNMTQTERYFYACSKKCENRKNNDVDYQLFVFLTPERKKSESDNYILVTYQDLVDTLFENFLKRNGIQVDSKNLIEGYIRNLGNPFNNKGIIAMNKEERDLLVKFYEHNKELFNATIEAMILKAEEDGDSDVAQDFMNARDSIKNAKRRYYTINGDGKYKMHEVLEEYINKRLDSEQFHVIQEELSKIQGWRTIDRFINTNDSTINKGSTGKNYKKVFYNEQTYYITKELADKKKGNNFRVFREYVNKNTKDFKIEQIID